MVTFMSPEPLAANRVSLGCIAPIFPVRDMQAACAHYRSLGFTVEPYEDGTEHAFAGRDDARLHLSYQPDHDPGTGAACVYLQVSDVDALAREWRAVPTGRTSKPLDREYKVREAAHIDLDNNMIRFGSPVQPS
jgi:hypothetical protein